MTLGDRLVVMNGVSCSRSIRRPASPGPVNRFVAGFVGTPSMNFIEGTLEGDGRPSPVNRRSFSIRLRPGTWEVAGCSPGGPPAL